MLWLHNLLLLASRVPYTVVLLGVFFRYFGRFYISCSSKVWSFVVLILSEFGCLLLLASRVPYTVVLLLVFF